MGEGRKQGETGRPGKLPKTYVLQYGMEFPLNGEPRNPDSVKRWVRQVARGYEDSDTETRANIRREVKEEAAWVGNSYYVKG